jgi:ABC-type transport system involved in cytochrome c biogenesis permease subunit
MARGADDLPLFTTELRAFHDGSAALARPRGEYDKIPGEIWLRRLDPFHSAVWWYLFAFLLLAVSWAWRNRWVVRAAVLLLLAAVILHATGIVVRCVLRERPPVSTLYDTMIFISGVGAVVCMLAELIHRRGIALALAPVVGGGLLFLANGFEASKAEDTMVQLVAVLDTNFWLALHVTFITIGYCGGLLASLVGHVHVLGRTFLGFKSPKTEFFRVLTRLNYGMLVFGLFFSVVGTILGGIWANESWGRFWGWDPKENGALMICITQVAMLHARMGGLIKPFGFAMASIFSGCVIAFSWWGVNLLGIGLHAYGFTGGIWTSLMIFYAVEVLVLAAGGLTWALDRVSRSTASPPAA